MSGKKVDYVVFFLKAGRLCLEAVKDTCYCVFLQTDRKHMGWIDKAYYLARANTGAFTPHILLFLCDLDFQKIEHGTIGCMLVALSNIG
jgi:hypothetical protein